MEQMTIEQMKKVELGILLDVAEFCEENGITYYLCGGTLIGAVRHQGFIPWDDDIDIEMPREDYMKFVHTYGKRGNYRVLSIYNDPSYYQSSAKVVDDSTILIENIDITEKIGVYIDIFPLDNLNDDYETSVRLCNKIKPYRNALQLKTIKVSPNRGILKNIVLIVGKFLLSVVDYRYLVKKIDTLAQKHNLASNSRYVGVISTMIYGEREIMERRFFNAGQKLCFEGNMLNCPLHYHEVLSRMYGDYMQLPPEEKRVTHHANMAYWKEGVK